MSVIGKYIYGIIPRAFSGEVNPRSLESEKASAQASGVTTCEQVYTISYQDISAVVSNSEIIDYTHMLKDALARGLLRHQQVIEEITLEHTVIPMRLGTFACDEDEIKAILAKGYRIIKDIFAKVSGKIEIDVACTWSDFTSTLKQIGEEKEIKEFKESLLSNLKGVTVDDQMKIGVMAKKALDQKRENYAFQIQAVLKTASCNFRDHELMDDKMVANFAFLIEKAKREEFDRRIEELNDEFNEKLNFRCVGPLPPYSFYTLQIEKIKFEDLDWARKKLRLNEAASKDEIKKAHQRSAFSLHPDKNPNTPGIEREFDDATRAYKILLDYCQACEQAGQKDNFSFNEEEVQKNAILVKVKE